MGSGRHGVRTELLVALASGASDIHIEAERRGVLVIGPNPLAQPRLTFQNCK